MEVTWAFKSVPSPPLLYKDGMHLNQIHETLKPSGFVITLRAFGRGLPNPRDLVTYALEPSDLGPIWTRGTAPAQDIGCPGASVQWLYAAQVLQDGTEQVLSAG